MLPFDDRDGWIWLDGEFVPWRESKLHVLSHGAHYASAVFEGERVYGGNIFKLNEHNARLINSARVLDFEIPWSLEEINAACTETVEKNNIIDGYVRPFAWRGSEMMAVSAQHSKIHLAVAVWEWPTYFSPEVRMKGLNLDISKWRRPAPDTAPTDSKAAGLYMICTLSKHKAEQAGFDDAMMLDYRGYVAESTGANIFFLIDNKIHTPTPDCFLDGITRKTVIELAKKRGFDVIERHIMPEELSNATESFLTGTAVEVTPIRQIGSYQFTPGNISKTLMADYDDLVRGKI